MLNRNMYIAQLPLYKQDRIVIELLEFYGKEFPELESDEKMELVKEVMCDKIWVLEDGFSDLLKELNI